MQVVVELEDIVDSQVVEDVEEQVVEEEVQDLLVQLRHRLSARSIITSKTTTR